MISMHFVLGVAAFLFFLHISCETLASFFKYNFASVGMHMQGISLSNVMAVVSRGFIALYGILIAYVIESNVIEVGEYSFVMCCSLIIGAIFSYFLSKISFEKSFDFKKNIKNIKKCIVYNEVYKKDLYKEVEIKAHLKVFVGFQFVAVAIAYGLCFSRPESRLLIISLVPLVSMLGTIVTVVFIEPRLAVFVDKSCLYAAMISRDFMLARGLSFLVSAVFMVGINFY